MDIYAVFASIPESLKSFYTTKFISPGCRKYLYLFSEYSIMNEVVSVLVTQTWLDPCDSPSIG